MIKLPKLGLRNISTSVSVLLVYLSFLALGRDDSFYACIAAVIATQINVEESIKAANARMIGTVLGGAIGFIFMNIIIYFNHRLDAVFIPLAVCLMIYLCTLLKRPASVQIGCVVILSTLISHKPDGITVYEYVFVRSADTFYGVLIAVLIQIVVWKILSAKAAKQNIK